MNLMNCNACGYVVQVNPTGICLGCQMGFSGPQKDSLKYIMEQENATQEREESKSNFHEYQEGNSIGKTAEASNSNSVKRGKKAKK